MFKLDSIPVDILSIFLPRIEAGSNYKTELLVKKEPT